MATSRGNHPAPLGAPDSLPEQDGVSGPMSVSEPRTLEIPTWVPPLVAAVAHVNFAEARARPATMGPAEALRVSLFAEHATALRRVATDERMGVVWKEIRRRKRGAEKGKCPFVHGAIVDMLRRCPQYQGLQDYAQPSDEYDRAQDQAAAVLFLEATGHRLRDRHIDAGPRTRTRAAVNAEAETLFKLAARHDDDAAEYDRLGIFDSARTLRALATASRKQSELRRPSPNDPWIVNRASGRVGDDWERGLIIKVAQTCDTLFGKLLLATVATIANVVLDRSDITKGKVQGVLKEYTRLPRPGQTPH
jgi:hypothetical protein